MVGSRTIVRRVLIPLKACRCWLHSVSRILAAGLRGPALAGYQCFDSTTIVFILLPGVRFYHSCVEVFRGSSNMQPGRRAVLDITQSRNAQTLSWDETCQFLSNSSWTEKLHW